MDNPEIHPKSLFRKKYYRALSPQLMFQRNKRGEKEGGKKKRGGGTEMDFIK